MGKFSHRVAEINKRHKKCHSPIKQNDHLKTVKVIKLAIESYVDSVHSFIFMHMPLCIQTESGFFKWERVEGNQALTTRNKQQNETSNNLLWNS